MDIEGIKARHDYAGEGQQQFNRPISLQRVNLGTIRKFVWKYSRKEGRNLRISDVLA
jgi:hypothetical protein